MTDRWALKAAVVEAVPVLRNNFGRLRQSTLPVRNKCPSFDKRWLVDLPQLREAFAVSTNTASTHLAQESRCEVCPLSRVKAGVAVRIKRLCAAPEVQNRLREIGLGEDQIIRLVTSQNNFICLVCNARLAISEQLAKLIMVEPVHAYQPVPR
jgi:Fe2+ transport system protein FeoA